MVKFPAAIIMAVRTSVLRRTQFYLNRSIRPLQRETPQVQIGVFSSRFQILFTFPNMVVYRVICNFRLLRVIYILPLLVCQIIRQQWTKLLMEGCASLQKEQRSPSLGRAREPANENQLHSATSNMVIIKSSSQQHLNLNYLPYVLHECILHQTTHEYFCIPGQRRNWRVQR